jgi:biopolymer transport protein ExbB/TolQ
MFDSMIHYYNKGGPTLIILIVLSVMALGIGLERLTMMYRSRRRMAAAVDHVRRYLAEGNVTMARAVNSTLPAHPGAQVFDLLLGATAPQPAELRRINRRIVRRAKVRMWLLATIGATSPFIGLFGTVLGIMEAFRQIGLEGAGGFQVVSGGISEALITTAAGIFVGVEAMALFNYLQAETADFAADLRDATEELNEVAARTIHVDQRTEARTGT